MTAKTRRSEEDQATTTVSDYGVPLPPPDVIPVPDKDETLLRVVHTLVDHFEVGDYVVHTTPTPVPTKAVDEIVAAAEASGVPIETVKVS